jgi:hypothetical protein
VGYAPGYAAEKSVPQGPVAETPLIGRSAPPALDLSNILAVLLLLCFFMTTKNLFVYQLLLISINNRIGPEGNIFKNIRLQLQVLLSSQVHDNVCSQEKVHGHFCKIICFLWNKSTARVRVHIMHLDVTQLYCKSGNGISNFFSKF